MKGYIKIFGLGSAVVPFIIGCSGGGSSTPAGTATSATMATVSGTVPGTFIEAFCEDGYYAQVTSNNNGTSQHPFEIDIPTNTNCTMIMTTNEKDPANRCISQVGFDTGNTTGKTFKITEDMNMGHIPLPMQYSDVKDVDGDHVIDDCLYVKTSMDNMVVNDIPVMDRDQNGMVDSYDDRDDDGTCNAYEDDDHDGIPNVLDDENNNNMPDYMDDDDRDGTWNHYDDDYWNQYSDYDDHNATVDP
ncbi:hypothetical protein [Sulfurovum lithotrophicum]|uniref:hypothetical protein n=1 Tax=Sulfurovum lithotrophicum TaxID=206403 RepID=UPI000695D23A|nr:hypothetical protein [Sulfurovum lithotrophicum]